MLQHLREDEEPSQSYYQRAIQLHGVLYSFRTAVLDEVHQTINGTEQGQKHLTLFTPIALCFSAELTLYFNHSCVDYERLDGIGIPEQITMQNLAISSIKVVCRDVRGLCDQISNAFAANLLNLLSPFVGDCLYQAARNIILLISGTQKTAEFEGQLQGILNALEKIGTRWRVTSKLQPSY